MKALRYPALLSATILATMPAAAQETSLVALADYDAIADLSATSLSPDGSRVAFIVSRVDRAANVRRNELAVVSTRGGEPRTVATGEVSAPGWSPDGKTLAWIAGGQLRLATDGMERKLDADGSAPRVQRFAWSPDGGSIALLAQGTPDRSGPDKSFEFADADYLGTTFLARDAGAPPAEIWIVDIASGARRKLNAGTGFAQDLAWRRDGRALIVQSQPGGSVAAAGQAGLLSVPVDGGAPGVLLPAPAQIGTGSRLRADGDGGIAFQTFHGPDPWTYANGVAVYRQGKVERISRQLDQQIDDFGLLPGGKGIVARAVAQNRERIWSISAKGAVTPIDLGGLNVIGGLDVGASGAISFVGSSAERTADLYYLASAKAKPVRLTGYGDALATRRLGKVERVTWTAGGLNHDGTIVYPPDYDRKKTYPLLVDIHGGPEASSTDAFDFSAQYFAAQGWIIFQPNYRGSTGQGDRYQSIIVEDLIKGSGEDVLAGVDRVSAILPVDTKRIAVTGYSWGGVMTSWLIGHDTRWCAAAPGGMAVDFTSYYDQSETAIWMKTMMGSPYVDGNIARYRANSPLTYLANVVTPTLVLHNAGDPNAMVTQSLTLHHFLKDRGVKTRMVLRDVDGHGYGDPFSHKQMYDLTMRWVSEHCTGAR